MDFPRLPLVLLSPVCCHCLSKLGERVALLCGLGNVTGSPASMSYLSDDVSAIVTFQSGQL